MIEALKEILKFLGLIVPIVSKIIEKVIHDQTINHLTENNVLYRYQWISQELPNGHFRCIFD